ncbi:MAG: hypothetical protein QF926_08025 [Alphaproteobacteria bacterium]|jgi:hypothetical protein|nr:hypothetical protein [Alphaproteobacteria bacterium]MDP6516553.1 hypothetical protein [Alphaproteobacteria bacterium]
MIDRVTAFPGHTQGTDAGDFSPCMALERKVGVFMPPAPKEHLTALHAFAEGLAQCGVDHFVTGLDYRDCDVAVVFGIRKQAVPASWARGAVLAAHAARDRRALILETGFIRRDEYFHAGFDGLNGRADFRNAAMPDDRWLPLGLALEPWRETGEHILVCGQVPWDASVQHHDHLGWCRDVIAELRRLTGRPIRFRPHPAVAGRVDYGIDATLSNAPLPTDLDGAWAVVTFNSNTAVEAAIAGIPVFALDAGSMALPVANTTLAAIEQPRTPDRAQWLADLAYAQWNAAELAAGETWRHLAAL